MHYNKLDQECGKREILFGCESEQQRDKWMAAIEYLKTRAIYDSYAKKHTLVNFIGQKTNEERKEDEAWNDKDNTNFLYDFGEKLKASSSFTPAMSHSSSV